MRVKGWFKSLEAVVQRHRKLPFSWGGSDCLTLTMDAVQAVTGNDPWADQRDYTTEQGAAKRMLALGLSNVGDAFAAKFPEIPVALMGRGDLATVERDGVVCGAVCVGGSVVGKSEKGLTILPRSQAVRAFKVD